MGHVAYPGCYCADCVEGANTSVSRYCAELNITNADHIALWLETNTEEPRIGWLAVQIAEAYERTINRKHVFYSPGEPDCPSNLLCSNDELHTLRCKVCGEENPRLDMPCKGEITSTDTPSARITGDKDRENPVEGAPYGEGLIGRIDTLDSECQRLRTVLQYIADLAYVDQQSGNQNFEYLQEIARAALQEPKP